MWPANILYPRLLTPCGRLGTIFYLSYLVFEYPQNLALQRFPVGKWMRCVLVSVLLGLPVLVGYR